MTIIRAILGKNMSMGEIQNGNFQKQRSTCTGQTIYVCEGRADDRWNCIFTGKRRKDAGSNHITWFYGNTDDGEDVRRENGCGRDCSIYIRL